MAPIDLSQRAAPHELPELMDQPCSFEELRGCLRDIARVNRLTLAYRPTLSWLADLMERTPKPSKPLQIVDVGCGYGDCLRQIQRWARRRRIDVALIGIDLNGDAIRAAHEATPPGTAIRWVHGDAFSCAPELPVDVVISSLLTHHLEEPEIARFLRWMDDRAQLGWFVNDLHRTPFPYRAFGWLTKLVRFHPFVQHDGLVSIRRSFLQEDWQRMCAAANLPLKEIGIREYRPARLCVGRIKAE